MCSDESLRLLRQDRRVSVRELAAAVAAECGCPVAASTVSRWERAVRLPAGERALALFRTVKVLAVRGD